ncbi:MAG: sulfurtransferase [Chloroflexi bacterium]|nr:sulfurtransferase [Chloroflexota bacterium]MXX81530.1 sulfurtransferase [Chloroflexota bacterium]MYD16321.1 sulfurtransferase [Chloroflexota bacterium]MYJ02696.1 sulfurtransferase [Chloroflexota bacterium]
MADYAHPEKLVSTDWVADNLDDPNVVLIEVDVDTSAYDEGHPPGAVAWNWTSQLQDQVSRDVASREVVTDLLRSAGANDDSQIVLFGDNNNWFAAYALWMLELYGVTNTALMDGGRVKWLAEGRVTTTDAPAAGSGSISVADRDESLRAKLPDVLAHVEAGGQLVDVRSPDEFNGVIMAPPGLPETAQRKGHVPGASNIPWATAVAEDGTFKSADELSSIYQAQGITGDQPVIAYCRIGERSSHSWFALRYLLGIDSTSNYDGSWTEYGSVVGVPIDNPSA